MTLRILVAVCVLLSASLVANYYQWRSSVTVGYRHKAEVLQSTINAYVQANVIAIERQQTVDKLAKGQSEASRASLQKIIAVRNSTIDKLRKLNAKSNGGHDCRVDAERVRVVNEKLSAPRAG